MPKRKSKTEADVKNQALGHIEPNVCVFCNQKANNEELYGKTIRKCGLMVHYFCMLFSSGLGQNGKSQDQGILGFLAEDIMKEVRRGVRLRCSFCKGKGATIGCVVGTCRKVFHFGCGQKNGTLHQYFDTYSSYCEDHRPKQMIAIDRMSFSGKTNTACAICLTTVTTRPSNDTLKAPCCRNAWFHRECVQKHATSSGLYFFKCPLCNNKEIFQDEMLQYGIYIPDQDAAWEREPHAYDDLHQRYLRCDSVICRSVNGRSYSTDGGKWQILVCDWCGSKGTHVGCHGLLKLGKDYICCDCKQLDDKCRKEKKLGKAPKAGDRFKVAYGSDAKTQENTKTLEEKFKLKCHGKEGHKLNREKLKQQRPSKEGQRPNKRQSTFRRFEDSSGSRSSQTCSSSSSSSSSSEINPEFSPGTVLRLSHVDTDEEIDVVDSESDCGKSFNSATSFQWKMFNEKCSMCNCVEGPSSSKWSRNSERTFPSLGWSLRSFGSTDLCSDPPECKYKEGRMQECTQTRPDDDNIVQEAINFSKDAVNFSEVTLTKEIQKDDTFSKTDEPEVAKSTVDKGESEIKKASKSSAKKSCPPELRGYKRRKSSNRKYPTLNTKRERRERRLMYQAKYKSWQGFDNEPPDVTGVTEVEERDRMNFLLNSGSPCFGKTGNEAVGTSYVVCEKCGGCKLETLPKTCETLPGKMKNCRDSKTSGSPLTSEKGNEDMPLSDAQEKGELILGNFGSKIKYLRLRKGGEIDGHLIRKRGKNGRFISPSSQEERLKLSNILGTDDTADKSENRTKDSKSEIRLDGNLKGGLIGKQRKTGRSVATSSQKEVMKLSNISGTCDKAESFENRTNVSTDKVHSVSFVTRKRKKNGRYVRLTTCRKKERLSKNTGTCDTATSFSVVGNTQKFTDISKKGQQESDSGAYDTNECSREIENETLMVEMNGKGRKRSQISGLLDGPSQTYKPVSTSVYDFTDSEEEAEGYNISLPEPLVSSVLTSLDERVVPSASPRKTRQKRQESELSKSCNKSEEVLHRSALSLAEQQRNESTVQKDVAEESEDLVQGDFGMKNTSKSTDAEEFGSCRGSPVLNEEVVHACSESVSTISLHSTGEKGSLLSVKSGSRKKNKRAYSKSPWTTCKSYKRKPWTNIKKLRNVRAYQKFAKQAKELTLKRNERRGTDAAAKVTVLAEDESLATNKGTLGMMLNHGINENTLDYEIDDKSNDDDDRLDGVDRNQGEAVPSAAEPIGQREISAGSASCKARVPSNLGKRGKSTRSPSGHLSREENMAEQEAMMVCDGSATERKESVDPFIPQDESSDSCEKTYRCTGQLNSLRKKEALHVKVKKHEKRQRFHYKSSASTIERKDEERSSLSWYRDLPGDAYREETDLDDSMPVIQPLYKKRRLRIPTARKCKSQGSLRNAKSSVMSFESYEDSVVGDGVNETGAEEEIIHKNIRSKATLPEKCGDLRGTSVEDRECFHSHNESISIRSLHATKERYRLLSPQDVAWRKYRRAYRRNPWTYNKKKKLRGKVKKSSVAAESSGKMAMQSEGGSLAVKETRVGVTLDANENLLVCETDGINQNCDEDVKGVGSDQCEYDLSAASHRIPEKFSVSASEQNIGMGGMQPADWYVSDGSVCNEEVHSSPIKGDNSLSYSENYMSDNLADYNSAEEGGRRKQSLTVKWKNKKFIVYSLP